MQKNRAEDVTLTKQSRLDRWTDVTSEYANVTGQTKSRTALMKRFSSVKYYRSHEGKPVSEGGRVKGCFKKSSTVISKQLAGSAVGLIGSKKSKFQTIPK